MGFSLLNFAKIQQSNNHGFPFEKNCVARQTLEQKSTKSVSEKEVVPIAKQKIKPSKTVKSKSSVVKQSERKIEGTQVVGETNEIVQNSIDSKAFSRSNKTEKPTKSNHISLGGMLLLLLFYLLLIGMVVGRNQYQRSTISLNT